MEWSATVATLGGLFEIAGLGALAFRLVRLWRRNWPEYSYWTGNAVKPVRARGRAHLGGDPYFAAAVERAMEEDVTLTDSLQVELNGEAVDQTPTLAAAVEELRRQSVIGPAAERRAARERLARLESEQGARWAEADKAARQDTLAAIRWPLWLAGAGAVLQVVAVWLPSGG